MKTRAEATVVQTFNRRTKEKNGPVGILFLIFLWLLSFHQGKESDRMLKTS
jgi:hypothetical protein